VESVNDGTPSGHAETAESDPALRVPATMSPVANRRLYSLTSMSVMAMLHQVSVQDVTHVTDRTPS
jgi:hypothetical protein